MENAVVSKEEFDRVERGKIALKIMLADTTRDGLQGVSVYESYVEMIFELTDEFIEQRDKNYEQK